MGPVYGPRVSRMLSNEESGSVRPCRQRGNWRLQASCLALLILCAWLLALRRDLSLGQRIK